MKPLLKVSVTLLLALVAGAFTQAHAQLLIDPATVEYVDSSGTVNGGVNFPAVNLINNAGLSSDLSTPGNAITLPTSFPTHDSGYANTFRSQPNQLGTLTFDLNTNPNTVNVTDPDTHVVSTETGSAGGYDLSALYVYAYNEDGSGEAGASVNRGLASTDLQYSTDGGATYTDYGTIAFTEAPGLGTYTGFQLDLTSTLNNVTNFKFVGGTAYSNSSYFVGLDAVRAIGTPASAPEPSTYVMLGAGILVLLVGFRRKANA